MLLAPMTEQSSAGLWEPRWYEPGRVRLDGLVESTRECLARLEELRRQWDLGEDDRARRVIGVRIVEEMALARAYMEELLLAIEEVRGTAHSAGPWRAEADEMQHELDEFLQWISANQIGRAKRESPLSAVLRKGDAAYPLRNFPPIERRKPLNERWLIAGFDFKGVATLW